MATWKKLVVSGSGLEQLDNSVTGYITAAQVPGASNSFATASFNGTDLLADSPSGSINFASGSGEGLTISANAGTDTLTFGLSAIPNSSLANSTISGVSLGSDLNDLTVDDSTIALDSGTTYNGSAAKTISIKDGGVTFAKLADALVITSGEGIASNDNDTTIATNAAIIDFVNSASLAAGSLSIGGDGATSTSVDLDTQTFTFAGEAGVVAASASAQTMTISLVDGGIANAKLTNSSITFGSDAVSLGDTVTQLSLTGFTGSFVGDLEGTASVASKTAGTLVDGNGIADFSFDGSGAATVSVQSDSTTGGDTVGVAVSANGVGLDVSGIAGAGISADGSGNLDVNVDDSTIEIATDTLQVKDGGITNAKLANTGFDIAAGTNGTGTTNEVSLGNTLTINGTADEIDIEIGTDAITIGLPSDVTIGQDLTVSRNLTVVGTASFQHETNLEVADRFIRLASGSAAAGDGGIVIQQASSGLGEVFGFENSVSRWAISSSFDGSDSTFQAEAFMAAVLSDTADTATAIAASHPTRYNAIGNIYVDTSKTNATDANIWIYA